MNVVIDWVAENTGKSLLFALAGFVVIYMLLKQQLSITSMCKLTKNIGFFSGSQNEANINKGLKQAFEEYEKIVHEQNIDLNDMHKLLAVSWEKGNAIIQRQLEKIDRFKVIYGNETLVSVQEKADSADKQIAEIQKMFRSYPVLPDKEDVTVSQIKDVQRRRSEHHELLMQVFTDYMKQRGVEIERLEQSVSVQQLRV